MRLVAKGSTSQSVYLEVLDSASTTGGRKTGIAFNAAGLTAYYTRNQAAAVAITLATQTAAGAYSSGGWVEVDATNAPGLYRLDVPNAAVASGVDSVVVTAKGASGMVQVSAEIQLTAANFQDAVRAGLTALPNANAEAAGGLYTRGSGAGQINQNASGQVDTRWVAGNVTVGTNNDKTGYTASTVTDKTGYALSGAGVQAIWDALTSALTTVGSVGKLLVDNLNATISSRMATFTLPTNFSSLSISAAGRVDVTSWSGAAVNPLVSGRVEAHVGAFTAGAITAAAIATDAIGAAELAADAVAEIADQVWDEVLSGHLTAGTTGAALNGAGGGVSAPTAAQNAAAVWDLAISGHTTSATFGNKVNGLTSGGSGGPVGSGSTSLPVTVTRPDNVTPVEGVAVWVSTDAAGTNVVAGTLYTDTLGRINTTVGFMLDPGTYYLWRQHGSWTFANPTSFTVS